MFRPMNPAPSAVRLLVRGFGALGDWSRAAVLAMPVLVLAAVAVGRQGAPAGGPAGRLPAPGRPVLINDFWPGEEGGLVREFDARRGTLTVPTMPEGVALHYAQAAPWVDAAGRSQVVASWLIGPSSLGPADGPANGLLRYELPGGAVLDRAPLDLVVAGTPCWFPDRSARVVVPTGDGRLYRFAFEGPDSGTAAVPIRWAVAPPWDPVHITDPSWPTDPRWGGRLFATLRPARAEVGAPAAGAQIWWLELDAAGAMIVAAGRVTDPEPVPDDPAEERCSSVTLAAGGRLAMAYYRRDADQHDWELRVAELALDPFTGAPRVRRGTDRGLARACATIPPVFGPDGRSVFALRLPRSPSARMDRLSLPAELLTPPPADRAPDASATVVLARSSPDPSPSRPAAVTIDPDDPSPHDSRDRPR